MFGVHGRAPLINISGAKDKFVELWNSGKAFEAYRHAYEAAVDAFNQELQSDSDENQFIKNLIVALKYWMRRDEEGVVLKQFTGTKSGTLILDAEKLDDMQDAGLNLVAQMAKTQEPIINIGDPKTKKVLIQFRAKGEAKPNNNFYFRNLVNKGKLFVELTNIR